MSTIKPFSVRVAAEWPHDPMAFTQGLALLTDGLLLESTGRRGSTIRKVELGTGKILQMYRLPPNHWGEGLAVIGQLGYQLTWKNQIGFVYRLDDLVPVETFSYQGEGWGLTYDGDHLLMSDGSNVLRFLDPTTRSVTNTVAVHEHGKPVYLLNDLTVLDDLILANVWKEDRIAQIDRSTGEVVGWLELGCLKPVSAQDPYASLNGIASDPQRDRLFVTGKLWPSLFELQIVRSG
jgi:glutaminyl-peptide cyclotransferase